MPKAYVPNDRVAKRARYQGFRARSVYKLEELDERFNLLQLGMKVLDLGAAPGSWLQYASEKVGPFGHILGIDLKPIDPVNENVTTVIGDLTNPEVVSKALLDLGWDKVDLLLSDVAPSTTGILHVDQKRSVDLDRAIFEIAKRFLKPQGVLILKVFQAQEFQIFVKELKHYFKYVVVVKADASRDRSREVYVACC